MKSTCILTSELVPEAALYSFSTGYSFSAESRLGNQVSSVCWGYRKAKVILQCKSKISSALLFFWPSVYGNPNALCTALPPVPL